MVLQTAIKLIFIFLFFDVLWPAGRNKKLKIVPRTIKAQKLAISKTPIFPTLVIKGILSRYILILVESPHMIQIIVF